jgi:broad specificity phosphatase PhoE
VPADLIHLVRHAEVHNPEGILYGRIPGYHLSELGFRMAEVAASSLAGHPIVSLTASPLQRAQESAQPWADAFELGIQTDERLIEPTNWFEGRKVNFAAALRNPSDWPRFVNPLKPSWGEPYKDVLSRMRSAVSAAYLAADGGEVVLVSHQMPIVTFTRGAAGRSLVHNPAKRRCSLSSITTFDVVDGAFREVSYAEPAKDLLADAVDTGAV